METKYDERTPLTQPVPDARRQHQQQTRQFACITILTTEILERIAFLSMAVTLGIFLNKEPLDWTSYNSIIATYILLGLAYTFSFVGSLFADTFFGRYKTICLFFLFYLAGYLFFPIFDKILDEGKTGGNRTLPKMCSLRPGHHHPFHDISYTTTQVITAHTVFNKPNEGNISEVTLPVVPPMPVELDTAYYASRSPLDENCAWPVYLFILFLAIGAGAVKANVVPFGAEHWKDETHPNRDVVQSFFDWFFWCANIGSMVALGVIAFVQQTYNFHAGYITSIISLAVALFFFGTGGRWFKDRAPESSRLTRLALKDCKEVLKYGCCLRSKCCWRENPLRSTVSMLKDVSEEITGTDSSHGSRQELKKPKSWFDYARREQCGGPLADTIVTKSLSFLKLFLVFPTFIPYWTIYHQMPTSFILQGLHMDLRTSTEHFMVPVAWLYLVEAIVMVFFIPLLDMWVYSKLHQRGRCPHTLRNRIAIGFMLSILGVVAAGLVEQKRLDSVWENVTINEQPNAFNMIISNTSYQAAEMSVAWQIPQYFLIGLGEVFASVAGLELAYSQAPETLKGISVSLFWFFCGIGSFFGAIFNVAFTGFWFFPWDDGNINCRLLCPKNINKICHSCHLDYYFFFLAAFGLLGLTAFWITAVLCGYNGNTELRSIDNSDAEIFNPNPVQRNHGKD